MSNMDILTRLIPMLKRHEGFRGKPYRCTAKKLTIGYGRNLDDVGITEIEASFLLSVDTLRSITDVMDIFPTFHRFAENRQIALANMMFNLGKTKFRKFVNMIDAVNTEDWDRVVFEAMDSTWYDQVGTRAVELVNLLREG